MSGVYIRGISVPPTGRVVFLRNDGAVTTEFGNYEIGRWVSIPQHGDLIDIDEYREDFMSAVYAELTDDPDWRRANRIIDAYGMAPVIIPADEKEADNENPR